MDILDKNDLVVDEIDEDDVGQDFFVYLLVSDDNSTYIGATVNLERRLRQHNKLIKGGAYATSSKVKKGQVWERAVHIEGFPSWSAALQFEWRWKQLSRKLSPNMFPLERRIRALKTLLELDKPTSKAVPYSDWSKPIKVIIETGEAQNHYDSIFTSIL
jgi:predicted GIY-YIG superfamily endonuclease